MRTRFLLIAAVLPLQLHGRQSAASNRVHPGGHSDGGPAGAQQPVARVRFLILLVTDLAEHYAQLASYMRQLGMVPPSALPPPR